MTNLALTHQPQEWYNKQWLVLILCLFAFPVGLYALWKSGKITKGWKVAGTIIVAIGVIGAADGVSEAGKSKTAGAAVATDAPVAEAPKNNAEEAKATPVDEKKDAGADKYLFESADDFKAAFNKHSSANDLDMTIDEFKISKGEVRNSFQYMFTDHLGIVGSVDKSTGRVIELMMLGSSDGTAKSGADLLLCMGAIIATADPSLAPAKRKDVLEDLGLFDKTQDFSDMSKKTDKNGIHYYIESNKVTGFIFGASKK